MTLHCALNKKKTYEGSFLHFSHLCVVWCVSKKTIIPIYSAILLSELLLFAAVASRAPRSAVAARAPRSAVAARASRSAMAPGTGAALEASCPVPCPCPVRPPERPPPLPSRCYTARDAPIERGGGG